MTILLCFVTGVCYSESLAINLEPYLLQDVKIVEQVLPTKSKNFIIEENIVPLPGGDSIISSTKVTYLDGLGRKAQEILLAASPSKKDIVKLYKYDDMGRQVVDYLPYTKANNNGAFDNFAINNQLGFYGDSDNDIAQSLHPYAVNVFENSPIDRVLKKGSYGTDWQPASSSDGHTIKFKYLINGVNEVRKFKINNDGFESLGYYNEASLSVLHQFNENWKPADGNLNSTKEYKNQLGQVLLKRSYVKENNIVKKLDTYYVYDDYGLLRFVLPPEAVKAYGILASVPESGNTVVIKGAESLSTIDEGVSKYIVNSGASLTLTNNFSFKATGTRSLTITTLDGEPNLFEELIFSYKYDSCKRMIEKKLPGAKPVYMVYDRRNRLIATQDGNQRVKEEWFITKYDRFNRAVVTALYSSREDRIGLQKKVNDYYEDGNNPEHPMYESPGNALYYYDNKSFPRDMQTTDVLTYNWYDNYDNPMASEIQYSRQSGYTLPQVLSKPKGLLTFSAKRVLNGYENCAEFIYNINIYDNKYNLVQSVSSNYFNGYDLYTYDYDMEGKLKKSLHEHGFDEDIVEEKMFSYDHAGRLTKVELEYKGMMFRKAKTTLFEMVYNELGQLKTKKLTGAGRSMDYQYNIRGWLTRMNAHKFGTTAGKHSDEFGFALSYQNGASSFGGQNLYNGNIGAVEWWSNGINHLDDQRQAYGYRYDALNRIVSADFREYKSGWKNTASTYDVSGISYDQNGNITRLNRFGAGSQIDQLTYAYNGNQLSYVNDGKLEFDGFKEFSNSTNEYEYDENGNMIRDDNKRIEDITYNYLNLPGSIQKKDQNNATRNVEYAYDASGTKLECRLPQNRSLQYCSNFVYENGSLKYILNEEGKLDVNATGISGDYKYFIKDHLGNTRLVVGEGENSQPTELNHYYPFGMRMAGGINDGNQKYKYNAKELQEETDWLDYGARMYDPEIGRWHCPDPLAEKYMNLTPYHYCYNSPINFIDPFGLEGEPSNNILHPDLYNLLMEAWKGVTVGDQASGVFGEDDFGNDKMMLTLGNGSMMTYSLNNRITVGRTTISSYNVSVAQSKGGMPDGSNLSSKEKFNKGYDKTYNDAYSDAFASGSFSGFIGRKFYYPSSSSYPKSLRRAFWFLSSDTPYEAGLNAGFTDGNYFGYVHGYKYGNNDRNDFIKAKGFAPGHSSVPYDPISPLLPKWYEGIGWK